ncbi:GNAT family N-acetyltransferase [Anaerorhabdus furcosa]|uniref:Putative acetyltransferase n=1 Tax=Anaerorhabdus furcosa TaxID=118967 RepID=A0A1T4JW88_9FIRM|nr:GNAT family N-acetyltransferase [Anaerorhabdus furcosa]SJZ34389.1 putative acetyltransferase [Anaerorhabdus furcosa]
MKIRKYKQDDCLEIIQLFEDTIKSINSFDYTPIQIDAWLNNHRTPNQWNQLLLSHHTYVAIEDNKVVGFADIDDCGYFDHLYVHKDYQHQGIATLLSDTVEELHLAPIIQTDASITARPFFERRGYQVLQEQHVQCNGIELTNYKMEKKMGPSN